MGNILFQNQTNNNVLSNGNLSDDLARKMYESNPQFKQFVDSNKNIGPRKMVENMGFSPDQLLSYANKFFK